MAHPFREISSARCTITTSKELTSISPIATQYSFSTRHTGFKLFLKFHSSYDLKCILERGLRKFPHTYTKAEIVVYILNSQSLTETECYMVKDESGHDPFQFFKFSLRNNLTPLCSGT